MTPLLRWMILMPLITYAPSAVGQGSCTGNPLPMNLGTYTGVESTSGTTTDAITCTNHQNWNIGFDAGTSPGATVTTRQMTGPQGAKLSYSIYRDAARTMNWGNTVGTDTLPGTGTGSAQNVSIYPILPGGQYPSPGSYTDNPNAFVYASPGRPVSGPTTVTATVQATCLASASDLNFGSYSGSPVTSTSTITVTCTNSTSYTVGLNAGTATGATVTTRKMTSRALATLNYQLFRDRMHHNWGMTIATDTVSGTGNGAAQTLTVYGQLSAGQSANPAVYTDRIISIITF